MVLVRTLEFNDFVVGDEVRSVLSLGVVVVVVVVVVACDDKFLSTDEFAVVVEDAAAYAEVVL